MNAHDMPVLFSEKAVTESLKPNMMHKSTLLAVTPAENDISSLFPFSEWNDEQFVLNLIIILAAVYIVSTGILNALSVFRIARRENIPHPWLAFIPFVRHRMLGKAADLYACNKDHPNSHTRRLTGWMIALWIVIPIIAAGLSSLIVSGILDQNNLSGVHNPFAAIAVAIAYAVVVVVLIVLVIGGSLSIGVLIYHCLCTAAIKQIIRHCSPDKTTLYTVLYLILPPLGAILLLHIVRRYCLSEAIE